MFLPICTNHMTYPANSTDKNVKKQISTIRNIFKWGPLIYHNLSILFISGTTAWQKQIELFICLVYFLYSNWIPAYHYSSKTNWHNKWSRATRTLTNPTISTLEDLHACSISLQRLSRLYVFISWIRVLIIINFRFTVGCVQDEHPFWDK